LAFRLCRRATIALATTLWRGRPAAGRSLGHEPDRAAGVNHCDHLVADALARVASELAIPFVAKDSRAPAKPEQRVVAYAIVSSEAMRNANAIVATGVLSS
jgi:hypothetical protein